MTRPWWMKSRRHWWMKGRHEPARWWLARLLRGRVDLTGYNDAHIDCSHAIQHAMRVAIQDAKDK